MAIHQKWNYPTRTTAPGSSTFTIVYYSNDREELEEYSQRFHLGQREENGTLHSKNIKPSDGIFELELVFESNSDGSAVEPPPQAIGSTSVQVRGSMLSLPLESHSSYRANWNYFLFCAPSESTVPAWWESAVDVILDATQSKKYAWGKTAGEVPVLDGIKWHILKMPTMPGVDSYDYASYTMTEQVSCESFDHAWELVKSRLNKIVTPFAPVSAAGEWKCDDANVTWTGKVWAASFSYTLSGPSGWNSILYPR